MRGKRVPVHPELGAREAGRPAREACVGGRGGRFPCTGGQVAVHGERVCTGRAPVHGKRPLAQDWAPRAPLQHHVPQKPHFRNRRFSQNVKSRVGQRQIALQPTPHAPKNTSSGNHNNLRRPQGTTTTSADLRKAPSGDKQRKWARFGASLGAPGTRRAGFRWGPRGAKRRRSPAYGRRRGRRAPPRTQRAELVAKRAPQFSRKSPAASGGENGVPSLPLRRCARPKKERFGVQWDMGCWLASPPDFLRRAELPESPAGQQ